MKIIVATDLSEHSTPAIRWAASLAANTSGELHAAHVIDNLGDKELWTVLFEAPDALEERVLAHSAEELRSFVGDALAADQTLAGTSVSIGQPADELAAYADRVDADLIVCGTSGHGRIRNALFGSTAYRLPHATTRPTAFVPEGEREAELEQILVAVDFSPCSEAALKWALRTLGPDKHYTVVHSLGLSTLSPAFASAAEFTTTIRALAEQRESRLRTMIEDTGMTDQVVISQLPPAEAILDVAKTGNFDAIVMGTHGLGAVERFVLGSVTQQVLRSTPCPVIAIQTGDK